MMVCQFTLLLLKIARVESREMPVTVSELRYESSSDIRIQSMTVATYSRNCTDRLYEQPPSFYPLTPVPPS